MSPAAQGQGRAGLEAHLRDVVRGSFPILPYGEAAATWHGEERARLEALDRSFVDGQNGTGFASCTDAYNGAHGAS